MFQGEAQILCRSSSHGWPGSVFEFLDLIPRLTDPERFGGDPVDAFTVVAPSLPGYGLSFTPGQKRFAKRSERPSRSAACPYEPARKGGRGRKRERGAAPL